MVNLGRPATRSLNALLQILIRTRPLIQYLETHIPAMCESRATPFARPSLAPTHQVKIRGSKIKSCREYCLGNIPDPYTPHNIIHHLRGSFMLASFGSPNVAS